MELLLVVLIIGLIFAFIGPKLIALRIEAQYTLVRQSAVELSVSVQQWVQQSMQAQDDQRSTATIADYVASLAQREPPDYFQDPAPFSGQWIASAARPNNWNNNNIHLDQDEQRTPIYGRRMGRQRNAAPETVIEDMIPTEKEIKNPFSKKNIFRVANDPLHLKRPVPGALAFAGVLGPDGSVAYGFCFQGRDSTTLQWDKASTFHDGQNLLSLEGISHCTTFAQYR